MFTAFLAFACVCAHLDPVLVQMPPGATPPAYLTPWHPEPFGNPGLAAELGLDRWYRSAGRVPANAEKSEPLQPPGGIATWPDDPLFAFQWSLEGGDFDVNALPAFMLAAELEAAGRPSVPSRLAILDSALYFPSLPQPWFKDIPIAEYWTILYKVPNPVGSVCDHSLHVSSIAGSRGNNALGIAGVNWNAELLSVQVLLGCSGQQEQAAQGVLWAADHGARVINMSLQYGPNPQAVFAAAIEYAAAQDVVIVAASGNYSWTTQTAVPSSFPDVIAVGAIDIIGARAPWSNAGPELDLCAPGVDVIGATLEGYKEWSGTSMASPHVAGAASLIRSFYPGLTAGQVRAALENTADDMGIEGRDDFFGHGRLNVYRALITADPCYADFNMDGGLTSSDFAAFQTAYASGAHRADCNGDGDGHGPRLTIADFACFQGKFTTGCN